MLQIESVSPPAAGPPPDNYLSRLSGYIPAEIIAAYAAVGGILAAQAGVSHNFYWLVFLVLLAFTPPYAWKSTQAKNLSTAWPQIAVATASFVIWVFALGGPFAFYSWYQQYYGSVLLILYTLLIPLLLS